MKGLQLTEALSCLVSQGGLHGLNGYFGPNSQPTNMPNGASLINAHRLLVCLNGTAHFRMDGSPKPFPLIQSHGLFVPSGHWVQSAPQQRYESLGIIFYPERIRIYRAVPVRENNGWSVQIPEGVEYKGVSPMARECLRILEETSPSADNRLRPLSAANLLLCECLRLSRNHQSAGASWYRWQTACHYMDEHLHEPINRNRVAITLGLHPNHLSRLFAQFSDKSFNHYVREARLARADLLLTNPRLNVSEVAHLCGFSSASYFVRTYHNSRGAPPGKSRLPP